MKFRVVATLAPVIFLVACGGGGGGEETPGPNPGPTPVPTNNPPTISLTVPSNAQVGSALVLDGSASTDPDGDALTFDWNFGDGTRGGTNKLAHIFATAGTFSVTLTVTDSRGAVSTAQRSVVVQAIAASAPVNTLAIVRDTAGNPLSGVAVSVVGSSATANTGADGRASVATAVGVPVTMAFSKSGYANQAKTVSLPASAESGYVEVTMLAREAALTLTNASTGGALTGKDGAKVTLPANALITSNGTVVSGAVQVNVTPVDVGANIKAFPGKFEGVKPDGEQGIILSYGTVEYALSQNGAPLNLAPGKTAQIEIPVYTTLNRDGGEVKLGDTYPLWSLDERTGIWIQEGTGTVVASASSPSGFALRGDVAHFSWWNHDIFDIPPYKPKPLCLVDTDHDGILENLTDTGYCWHYGTGPDQPPLNTQPISLSKEAQRALAKSSSARRLPAVAAYDSTPVGGGKVLAVPANLDITFISTAKNGTLRGTKVVRGASNVEENVTFVLYPVGSVGPNENITLPYDQSFVLSTAGELDGFNFNLAANEQLEVRITQSQGATVTGAFTIKGPNNTVLGGGALDAAGAPVVVSATQSGQHRIELTASGGVPGGYRIQVRTLGCDSTTAVTLPLDQQFNINGNGIACFNVTLPANTALSFELPYFSSGLTGVVSVLNGSGAEFGRDDFGGAFNAGQIYLGVRQTGTYRIRVANAQPGPGNFTLRASTVSAEALAVPGSASWNDVTISNSKRVLITPPSDGLHSVTMTTTGGSFIMQVDPQAAAVTPGVAPAALAVRVHPDVLSVVHVARTGGATTETVTLTTGVPLPLPLNTDVAGTVSQAPVIYWFEGTPGQRISSGIAGPAAEAAILGYELRSPSGGVVNAGPNIFVPPTIAGGVHTAVLRPETSGTANFVLRVNTFNAPEPLVLTTPLTQRTVTLALGETKHYTMNLAQAEVFAMSLATPGPLEVTAAINGINDGFASTPSGSSSPKSAWMPGRYVRTAGEYTLRLYSNSKISGRATGSVTVGLLKPEPTPVALNTAGNATVAIPGMESRRFTVAAGRYLLRFARTASECCGYARLWSPSTTLSNYSGELTLSGVTGNMEGIALLTAGNQTLTLERSAGFAATEDMTFSLVDLETPAALTVGGGSLSGTIDVTGERDYFQFTAASGQAYTVNVSAGFSGTVYVSKIGPFGDFTGRAPLVAPLPTPFVANTPLAVSFTIPTTAQFGNGTYIVEVSPDGNATGNYNVSVTSP